MILTRKFVIADLMRNHPSRPISFPEWERFRTQEKNQAARRVNPKHAERTNRIATKRCKPFAERGIILDNLPPHSIVPRIIEQQQWSHFIRVHPLYDEELVKEFYANMNPPVYNERYTVVVRGRTVRISPEDICAYHQTPRRPELGISYGLSPHQAFTENLSPMIAGSLRRTAQEGWVRGTREILKSDLHTDLAFLMLFVKSSLKPSSHNTTADPQVAQVLFSLQQGLPLDVGLIIWMELLDAGISLDGVLPFPCMITHFCQQAGIQVGPLTPPKKNFDRTHYDQQIQAAINLDRKREEERRDHERSQYIRELGGEADYSEGEYEDPDFTIPDDQDYDEYQHTGDTPPWARHMMQTMNQGFQSLNAQISDLADRMDRAGIPEVPREEQRRRRVRGRGTGGASTSHG